MSPFKLANNRGSQQEWCNADLHLGFSLYSAVPQEQTVVSARHRACLGFERACGHVLEVCPWPKHWLFADNAWASASTQCYAATANQKSTQLITYAIHTQRGHMKYAKARFLKCRAS